MHSRKSSKRSSRRSSKKKLNPALKEMSQIVKKLSKCGVSGPQLMKEASKVYHGKKSMATACKSRGSRKSSRGKSRSKSRK